MSNAKQEDLQDGEMPKEPEKSQEKPQGLEQLAAETPAKEQSAEEPFDKERAMATIKNLREIEKQAKKDKAELEKLRAEEQKRIEAEMSETERLSKQAQEAQARAAQLEAELLRRDVITETGLPPVLAERLKGSTKEEMLADAEALKKALPLTKVAPHIQPNNPANGEKKETDAEMRERLFGKQGNVFDMNAIKKGGGGVVWPETQE